MRVNEVIRVIERTAPLLAAAPWDVSGVQVFGPDRDVRLLAVMLDPREAQVAQALDIGADLILAHHPLSMKPRFLNQDNEFRDTVKLLLGADVCLYSAHTSLDANCAGPVSWLADSFGLTNRTLLEPTCEGFGFGWCGDLPETLPYDRFCTLLARHTGLDSWRTAGPLVQRVSRIACCPGSGSDFALAACQAGADVFLTGDCKYHMALETPIRTLDLGHFTLEEIMMRRFADQLDRELSGVSVTYLSAADPFRTEHARISAEPDPSRPKEESH